MLFLSSFLAVLVTASSVLAAGNLTEVERTSLLSGPAENCDDDGCVTQWAVTLAAQGLVTEFEQIYAAGLPTRLAAYLDIDAKEAVAHKPDYQHVVDNIFARQAKAPKLECCPECNLGKKHKVCSIANWVPILLLECQKQMHRCCEHYERDICKCTCLGKYPCLEQFKQDKLGMPKCKF